MLADVTILLIAIDIGAAVHAGVGAGFSIVVAPIMIVLPGTATALLVLLMLNGLVSAVAIEPRIWATEKTLFKNTIIGCLVGRFAGPLLPQRAISQAIRVISVIACAALFRRSYRVGD